MGVALCVVAEMGISNIRVQYALARVYGQVGLFHALIDDGTTIVIAEAHVICLRLRTSCQDMGSTDRTRSGEFESSPSRSITHSHDNHQNILIDSLDQKTNSKATVGHHLEHDLPDIDILRACGLSRAGLTPQSLASSHNSLTPQSTRNHG